jgi:hypothetical protein
MLEDDSAAPSDAAISSYLQLPLRTQERVQQDRENRLRKVAARLARIAPRIP